MAKEDLPANVCLLTPRNLYLIQLVPFWKILNLDLFPFYSSVERVLQGVNV